MDFSAMKEICFPGAWRFSSLERQISVLQEQFPQIDKKDTKEIRNLARGLPSSPISPMVFPKSSMLAGNYHEATRKITEPPAPVLLINYVRGKLDSEHLQLTIRTAKFLVALNGKTEGKLSLLPVQPGHAYQGLFWNEVSEKLSEKEFALGPYEIAMGLLTGFLRLRSNSDLRLLCSGCVFSPEADGDYSNCLIFEGNCEGRWLTHVGNSTSLSVSVGSPTGFLV